MALRENVFEKFGPILIESLFDEVLDEINALRVAAGLPERPKAEFLGSAHNHINHLDPYTWMGEDP